MSIINGKACVVNGTPVDKVFSNGVQVYGRNLIIRTGELANTMVGMAGDITGWAGSALMADKITVTPGEVLTFSRWGDNTNGNDSYFRYGFYTDTDVVVTRQASSDYHFTITVPANATNLKVSYPVGSQVKLEKGATATGWTPALEDILTYSRNFALGTATPFVMTGDGSTNISAHMYSTSGTIAKGLPSQ